MSLHARIVASLGGFTVDAALDADAGQVLALIGPNGSGKTQTLAALAGLRPLDAGIIRLDDRVLDEPGTNTWVPAAERRVGIVFQDLLLFRHLSALDNVAYGLRRQGLDRRSARQTAWEWLERLEVADRGHAKPAALSGGEAQRVALARALAPQPRLLLLDEPLSALDTEAKGPIRALLARHLAAFDGVVVLVTHDLADVLNLAQRVVVLDGGRTVEVTRPAELITTPASPFAAAMAGINLLVGECHDGVFRVGDHIAFPAPDCPAGPATAALDPHDIQVVLSRRSPDPTYPGRSWETTIEDMTVGARGARVVLGPPIPITAQIDIDLVLQGGLRIGSPVQVSVDTQRLPVRSIPDYQAAVAAAARSRWDLRAFPPPPVPPRARGPMRRRHRRSLPGPGGPPWQRQAGPPPERPQVPPWERGGGQDPGGP